MDNRADDLDGCRGIFLGCVLGVFLIASGVAAYLFFL